MEQNLENLTKLFKKIFQEIREKKKSYSSTCKKVPLLNHHTSGVRMEWYRDDLDEALEVETLSKT